MTFNLQSYLGLGIMRHGVDQEHTNQLLAFALKNNINYFEACDFYLNKKCEERLSESLKNIPRNQYYLCDKLPLTNFFERGNELNTFFQNQLKKCNTSYFDVYLIQAVDRSNYQLLKSKGVIDFFNQKKKEGLIHNFGFSFHDKADILKEILEFNNWDVVQLQLNYYDWYLGDAKKLYLLVKSYDLPIITMGPTKGGLLIRDLPQNSKQRLAQYNINPAHLCYKFLTTLSNVKIILSGAETIEMLQDNLNYFKSQDYGLTKFEKEQILLNLEDYRNNSLIQCTNCKYCITNCPKNIPINEIFYNYNHFMKNPNEKNKEWLYNTFKSEYSIFKCQHCGVCEKICPQKLPIQQLFNKKIFPLRL